MAFYVQRQRIDNQPDTDTPELVADRLRCGWFEEQDRARRLADRLNQNSTYWGYTVTEDEPTGPSYAAKDRIYVLTRHAGDGIYELAVEEGWFDRFTDAEERAEQLTTVDNKRTPPMVEALQPAAAGDDPTDQEEPDHE